LFRPIFVPDRFREAVGGRAWLQAMLDAEAALVIAEARIGLIPTEAAEAIAASCNADRFDPEEIGHEARATGLPIVPLARALTEAVSEVSEDAARYVHKGSTSQDITDTAAMLVARRTIDLITAEVDGVAAVCARLADEHGATLMAGRMLLQQALRTTFGLKAAGWLVAVLEARQRLLTARDSILAAQLGGAAGTLASLGPDGLRVLREFARELGLAEWETLSDALALTGGAATVIREAMEGLQVHPQRMRENLDVTKGLLLAENVTTILAGQLGRLKAHELVKAASHRALNRGTSLREELLSKPALRELLSPEEIDAALDSACYLGSAEAFVERALDLYHKEGMA
jgi:adenylosuccinate lyase